MATKKGSSDGGVYRVTEVIGTSRVSWEDAAKNAVTVRAFVAGVSAAAAGAIVAASVILGRGAITDGATLVIGGRRAVDGGVFAAVVVMVIVTTLLTPPLLAWRLSRDTARAGRRR